MIDKLIIFFVFLILIALGFIGYEATQSYQSPKEMLVTELTTPECDLQKQDCEFEHPLFGNVKVSITPRPIKMNVKQRILIESEKEMSTEGWVDFLGLEMDMGFNRPKLIPVSDKSMAATVVLPTCTQTKMTWKSTVILKSDKNYGAPFKFRTIKE